MPLAAPILSTPESHLLDSYTSSPPHTRDKLSDDLLRLRYEVDRTIAEIMKHKWRRIALQFPDLMLPDAPRVSKLLSEGLQNSSISLPSANAHAGETAVEDLQCGLKNMNISEQTSAMHNESERRYGARETKERIYILGDTSYGACCVDEIAAEHVSADAVIHYGRACLSPTLKLPVLHIFTIQPLDENRVISTFEATYPEKDTKVLLMADVTYNSHVALLADCLANRGYASIFATEVVRNPSSLIPNRTVPSGLAQASGGEPCLSHWHLFHIADPPSALLLTLASRVSSIRVYSDAASSHSIAQSDPSTSLATPMPLLRRRYGLLTRLRTATVIGILINTLSASSTLPILSRLKSLIEASGKKYYTVVVGKVNAAKLANFAEIDGWVVVGCWESSLLEDEEGKGGTGWWKPCVTPWELEAALGQESSGIIDWRTDLETLLDKAAEEDAQQQDHDRKEHECGSKDGAHFNAGPLADEEESEPPVFDLRTGKYVSGSQPMRAARISVPDNSMARGGALTRTYRGDVTAIGGVSSPGAAFLREKRTWRGLGSDFEIAYEEEQGGQIEEGRSGLARGYSEEQRYRS